MYCKNCGKELKLDDIKITPIPTSHDAIDSRGYIFESGKKSVVYMTDTGYINRKYYLLLTIFQYVV